MSKQLRVFVSGFIVSALVVLQGCSNDAASVGDESGSSTGGDSIFLPGPPRPNDGESATADFESRVVSTQDLVNANKTKNLKQLELARTKVANKKLDSIAKITQLELLSLAQTNITDAGMARLQSLKNLRVLNLRGTAIGDAGIEALKSFTHLEDLNLAETQVTDSGIQILRRFKELKYLDLRGTQLSDDGLMLLSDSPALRWVSISQTKVTPDGFREFNKSKDLVARFLRQRPIPETNLVDAMKVSDEDAVKIKKLIASLSEMKQPYFGVSSTLSGHAFAPIEGTEEVGTLMFTDHKIQSFDAFRELVQLGPQSLGFLLSAVDNNTPTGITMDHGGGFGGMWFANELWGNPINRREQRALMTRADERHPFENHINKYVVKVGDLCLVAIGQIVGRHYHAVRYQPSACIVINSPTHDKVMCRQVREIWSSETPAKTLFDSLILDYSTAGVFNGESLDGWGLADSLQCEAAMRLLYYFPKQTSDMLAKRLSSPDVSRIGLGRAVESSADELDAYIKRELKNGVRADDFIKSVAWSTEPAVRAALTDIFKKTDEVDILLVAVPGAAGDPKLIRQRLSELLDQLPSTEGGPFGDGYNLLIALGKHGGDDVKGDFKKYLLPNTVQRCRLICHALRQIRPEWANELLIPLLSDKRESDWTYAIKRADDNKRLPIRVCDEAAETIAMLDEKLSFEMSGTHSNLDAKIQTMRKAMKK